MQLDKYYEALKEAFNTKEFYYITSNEYGHTLYYGNPSQNAYQCQSIETNKSILGIMDIIENEKTKAPILIYKYGTDNGKNEPLYIINASGECVDLENGYYLRPTHSEMAKAMINNYFLNPSRKPIPDCLPYVKWGFEEKNPLKGGPMITNLEKCLGTNCFYMIGFSYLVKWEDDKNSAYAKGHNISYLSDAAAFVIDDKKKDGNNYPVIFFSASDKPRYVHYDSGEVKTIYEGYYVARDILNSVDEIIERIMCDDFDRMLVRDDE